MTGYEELHPSNDYRPNVCTTCYRAYNECPRLLQRYDKPTKDGIPRYPLARIEAFLTQLASTEKGGGETNG